MQTSLNGINLIKRFEGLKLAAYKDSVGLPTIGYGHTQGVKMGDVITPEQADALLRDDVRTAEMTVSAHVSVSLTQGQFDALVSFVFNLGAGDLLKSTLLRKLNAGDSAGAAAEFPQWDHADGKALPGLAARRTAEQDMFIS